MWAWQWQGRQGRNLALQPITASVHSQYAVVPCGGAWIACNHANATEASRGGFLKEIQGCDDACQVAERLRDDARCVLANGYLVQDFRGELGEAPGRAPGPPGNTSQL